MLRTGVGVALLVMLGMNRENRAPQIFGRVPSFARACAAGFLVLAGVQALAGHALFSGAFIGTADVHGTAQSVLQLLTYCGFFILCANAFAERKLLEQAVLGVALIALLLAVAGTIAYFREGTGHIWLLDQKLSVTQGSFGFFPNENHFGAFAILALPLVGAVVWHSFASGQPGPQTYLLTFVAFFTGAAVVISEARYATAVFAAAVAGVIVWAAVKKKLSFKHLAGFGLLAAALIASIVNKAVLNQFTLASLSEALALRVGVMRESINIFFDRPLFGVGLGAYRWVSQNYVSRQADESVWWNHAHNDYVELLAETGIVGTALFALCAASLLTAWIRKPRTAGSRWTSAMRAQALLAIGGFALLGTTDFPAKIPALALLAAFQMGILAALQPLEEKGATAGPVRSSEKFWIGILALTLLISSAAAFARTGPQGAAAWHADGRQKIREAEQADPETAGAIRHEAIRSLKSAAELVPTHAKYWFDLGNAEFLWGNRDEGVGHLEAAAQNSAASSLYSLHLISVYLFLSDRESDAGQKTRRRDQALAYYEKLRSENRLPAVTVQRRTMGEYYFDRLQNLLLKDSSAPRSV